MLVLTASSSVYAAMSGTETSGVGWYSSNTFVAPFTWSVNKNVDNTWTYDYQFTPASIGRGVSFVSLEIGGTPTLSGSSTIAANSNPNYLDPTLSSRGPMYTQWATGGSGNSQTWTTYNYSSLSYSFLYTTSYSTADPATLDKQQAILSLPGTVDVRPNPTFTSSVYSLNGSPTRQFDAGSVTAGNVSTTMYGLTWFLPSQEFGVPSGSGAGAGGGREAGAVRGYNAGWELTLTTTAAPMWGDFFLDGGDWKSDSKYLQGANAGYDGTAPEFAYLDGTILDNMGYIPTPNFASAPVPIPPVAFLFGSGLSGLFFFRRRKYTA